MTTEIKASAQYFLVVRFPMMFEIFLTRTAVVSVHTKLPFTGPFQRKKYLNLRLRTLTILVENLILHLQHLSHPILFLVGEHSGLSFVFAASGLDDTIKASYWSDPITLDLSLFLVNEPSLPFSLLLTNGDLFSIAPEISVAAFVFEFSNCFFFASWSSRFCFLHFALLFLNQTCLTRR